MISLPLEGKVSAKQTDEVETCYSIKQNLYAL